VSNNTQLESDVAIKVFHRPSETREASVDSLHDEDEEMDSVRDPACRR
jgi:hypothetical protein